MCLLFCLNIYNINQVRSFHHHLSQLEEKMSKLSQLKKDLVRAQSSLAVVSKGLAHLTDGSELMERALDKERALEAEISRLQAQIDQIENG